MKKSQQAFLKLLTSSDLNVLSIGIDADCLVERKMIELNSQRQVIATTIDKRRLEQAKSVVKSNQLSLKLEDLRKPLHYDNIYFDLIYARLVLHYLTTQELTKVLNELKRVLKNKGKLFIVVRSVNDWEAKLEDNTYDGKTGMTAYSFYDLKMNKTDKRVTRRFDSKKSITNYLKKAGFKIKSIKEYKEQLTVERPKLSTVIELVAEK